MACNSSRVLATTTPLAPPVVASGATLTACAGAIGVKTGSGPAAGYCLVFAATRGGRTVIGTVLASSSVGVRAADATKLLNYGFQLYDSVRVYAMDARNGYTAFGALNLAPPPPAAKIVAVAPPKAPAGPPPPPHVWDPRDDITQRNFEDAPAHAAPRQP